MDYWDALRFVHRLFFSVENVSPYLEWKSEECSIILVFATRDYQPLNTYFSSALCVQDGQFVRSKYSFLIHLFLQIVTLVGLNKLNQKPYSRKQRLSAIFLNAASKIAIKSQTNCARATLKRTRCLQTHQSGQSPALKCVKYGNSFCQCIKTR